ncbi:uncharacterized protein LOC143301067 [Babylonia areolata]|uniref:uncharacterized protein LOC143301067 n=1 Tax=Babylonia areolata TaxID=304850 RepID=UPI003FD215BE
MQGRRESTRPRSLLCLGAVTITMMMMIEVTTAYNSFCSRPANMEICFPEVSKRFLRFGRALTNDHFLRFGRGMDKRFLRFGRSDAEPTLDDLLRLAIARADAAAAAEEEEAPMFIRKRRSAPEAPQVLTKAVAASSDHPEGVAKREAGDSALPMEEEKRFMRFGRSGGDDDGMQEEKRFMRFGKRFMRFGRGGSEDDSDALSEDKRFMRFGKRFMRFGRGGSEDDGDDSLSEDKRFMRFGKRFMRFGRNPEDGQDSSFEDEEADKDKRFMRFGKRFMRFGRGGQEDDLSEDKRFMRFGKRFMRFGRDPMEAEKRFMRFGRSSQDADDAKAEDKRFMRFGKRFMRFGKRAEAAESKSEKASSCGSEIVRGRESKVATGPCFRLGNMRVVNQGVVLQEADTFGFNNLNKRFLRFGRGDPFLRFGKRSGDAEDLQDEFLRFGRSLSRPSLLDLLASEGALSRKRRDVSAAEKESASSGLKRTARDVQDGGFLRFGRGGDEADAKRNDVPNGDREYLHFGRRDSTPPTWVKRYLRFGRNNGEAFLRFGKRTS